MWFLVGGFFCLVGLGFFLGGVVCLISEKNRKLLRKKCYCIVKRETEFKKQTAFCTLCTFLHLHGNFSKIISLLLIYH